MKKIRVLVVDDSALMRQILSTLISTDPGLEVIGTAADPFIAREKIKALAPDVLTLDVEMPKMDGLTFLEKLMKGHPMPVVMVSTLTEAGCETTIRALELGAVDFFAKPQFDMEQGMRAKAKTLTTKIKVAARAKIIPRQYSSNGNGSGAVSKLSSSAMTKTTDTIIAIGASTGGTEALRDLLTKLPPNTPPIIITQHMPEQFTKMFADRLNDKCRITVKEAVDGDSVLAGHALIAPGNYHMSLSRSGARYRVCLDQSPRVNRHRPSVDVLFRSVSKSAGKNAIGIILTGMGGDGAEGMREMKDAGAYNIAQDESSCVVFGMPKVAIEKGGVDEVCPLPKIAGSLFERLAN